MQEEQIRAALNKHWRASAAGDADAEQLEGSRIRALVLLHTSVYPGGRIDRRDSAIRMSGSRRAITCIASRSPLLRHARARGGWLLLTRGAIV